MLKQTITRVKRSHNGGSVKKLYPNTLLGNIKSLN